MPPLRRAEQIMAMPAVRSDWTVEMLDALPEDGQRYEVIEGVLTLGWHPSGMRAPMLIDIPSLFSEALGEPE